jgi:hypothetical protein
MTNISQLRFAPAVQSMLDFIAPYRGWIEKMVGTSFSNTVTFELETPLTQTVVSKFLKGARLDRLSSGQNTASLKSIRRWSVPPGISPRVALSRSRDDQALLSARRTAWTAEWIECPVALWLRGLRNAMVAVNVPYVSFAQGLTSDWKHWIIVNKTEVTPALELLETLLAEPSKAIMAYRGHSTALPAGAYNWDKLVLDPVVTRLVKRDFETLFDREKWFHENGLPFHRGYLFYGPPGNGKTSVIRVMAAHPAIAPYTINLHGEHIDDDSLTELFELAYASAPALIILEDIDRLFPEDAEDDRRTKVSLQHLLNCLDGVIVNDGVIVVGTANNPSALDPAILKRPGRFDRVVAFKNPTAELRLAYLLKLASRLEDAALVEAVAESEGFSFAHLRECYILAAQFTFEEERDITGADLAQAVKTLRSENSAVKDSDPTSCAGFRFSSHNEPATTVQRT